MLQIPWYISCPLIAGTTLGALSFWANRAAFFPSKYPEGFWDLQGQFGAADVWINTSDGVRIHGWYAGGNDGPVTLFFHGNAGNITDRAAHFGALRAAGSSILILDYRGYGKSAGRPTEAGIYKDADAGYDYLIRTGHPAGRIVIQGESLGSAVAVDLAARKKCAGVILEAPFTSGRDVAQTVLPGIGPLLVWGFDSRAKIGRIHAPKLFIQGDRDEVIPLRLGQALYSAATEHKSFWVVPGAGHNNLVEAAGAAYVERLREFYQIVSSRTE